MAVSGGARHALSRRARPHQRGRHQRPRGHGPSTRLAALMVAAFTLGLLPGVVVGLSGTASAAVGRIDRVAGTGTAGYGGDGGSALAAQLRAPSGMTTDRQGSTYVADQANNRIRKITPGGVITTVAGTGSPGWTGDGGLATAATLTAAYGVAVDGVGNVYFSSLEHDVVRRVDAVTGIVTRVAGGGKGGQLGDGGPATDARLMDPYGLAIASDGDLLVADAGNRRVRRVDAVTSQITTVAGTGFAGMLGEGGAATSAQLAFPLGFAVDSTGTYWISDGGNHRVLRVSAGTLTRVAGTGMPGSGGDGGLATSASLSTPAGLAVGAGSVFIAENSGHRIRQVHPDGRISTLAGSGAASSSGDGGPAGVATVWEPSGLSVDRDGDLLLTERSGHVVRAISGVVPPQAPVLTGSTPASPGRSTAPAVRGVAPDRTTVTLHTDPACTSAPAGTGTAGQLGTDGIAVAVPAGTTATFWATATSTGGAVSACSTTAVTYTSDTTPPVAPTITASPASPSRATSLQWSFTTEAGASARCELRRDTTVVRSDVCTSPAGYDLSGEADGTWTLAVTATDAAGNASTAGTSPPHVLDRSAPASPAHTTPASSSATPSATWAFTAEAGAVTRCALLPPGGVAEASAVCASPVSYDLTGRPAGAYAVVVTATDAAGNASTASTSAAYTLLTADAATPVFTATPQRGVMPLTWTFTVTGTSSPTCALTRDGVAIASPPCASPYQVTPTGDATYALTVTGSGPSATSTYVHDTTPPPAPTITSGPPSTGAAASVAWSFTATELRTECALLPVGTPAADGDFRACSSPFSAVLASQGTWRLSVRAVDPSGNPSTATERTYAYDATPPPAPALTASQAARGLATTAAWTFTSSGGTAHCRLLRGTTVVAAEAACTSPVGYALDPPVEDTYTVEVVETDAAGNRSPAGTGQYVLDRTPPPAPALTRTSPAADTGSSTTPRWELTAETGAVLTCRLLRDGAQVVAPATCSGSSGGTGTYAPTLPAVDGTYVLEASARDVAGNAGPVATSSYRLDTVVGAPVVTASQPSPSPTRQLAWTWTTPTPGTADCRLTPPATAPGAWGACPPPSYALSPTDPDGTWTFEVRITDAQGGSRSTAATHVVDTRPPGGAPLLTAPASPGASTSPQLGVDVAPIDRPHCAVRRAADSSLVSAWTACSSWWTFDLTGPPDGDPLPDGEYLLAARAVDTAGNAGPEATAAYELLLTPPGPPALTDAPPATTTDSSLRWSFALPTRATAQCTLLHDGAVVDPAAPCTSPVVEPARGTGRHALRVQAVSASGVLGPVTESVVDVVALAGPVPPPTTPPATTPPATTPPATTPPATTPPATTPPATTPPATTPPATTPPATTPPATTPPATTPPATTPPATTPPPSGSPTPGPSITPTGTGSPSPVVTPTGPIATPSGPVAPSETLTPPPAPPAGPVAPVVPPTTPTSPPPTATTTTTPSPDAEEEVEEEVVPTRRPSPSSSPSPSPDEVVAPAAPSSPEPSLVPAAAPLPVTPGDAPLEALGRRAGEVGEALSDATAAVLDALSPASLGRAAEQVARFVAELDAEDVAHAASVAAPKSAFPLGLVLMVGGFLAVQNRIDRNDPKLALAPVHGDRHLDFGPHPASRAHDRTPTDPGEDR